MHQSHPRHAAPPRGRPRAAPAHQLWVPPSIDPRPPVVPPGVQVLEPEDPLPTGHVERWARRGGGVGTPAVAVVPAGVVVGRPPDRPAVVDPFGRAAPPRPQWSPVLTGLACVPSQRAAAPAAPPWSASGRLGPPPAGGGAWSARAVALVGVSALAVAGLAVAVVGLA